MRRIGSKFEVRRDLLEALARTGSPVDMTVADDVEQHRPVEIQQVGGVYDSKLFELESGRLGFMVDLAITNQTSQRMQMIDLELRSALIDASFQWLTPLTFTVRKQKGRGAEYRAYQFPGRCGLRLPYEDVLNHRLVEHGLLPSRRRLEGWLVGIGGLMPAGLIHGQRVDLALCDHRI